MAPLEEDSLFKHKPDRSSRPHPKRPHERVPYHELTPEERRAAWAELRSAQAQRARRSRGSPLLWGAAAVLTFVAASVLARLGYGGLATVTLWIAIAFVAFTIVALGRGLIGRGASKKDDFSPPGF